MALSPGTETQIIINVHNDQIGGALPFRGFVACPMPAISTLLYRI